MSGSNDHEKGTSEHGFGEFSMINFSGFGGGGGCDEFWQVGRQQQAAPTAPAAIEVRGGDDVMEGRREGEGRGGRNGYGKEGGCSNKTQQNVNSANAEQEEGGDPRNKSNRGWSC